MMSVCSHTSLSIFILHFLGRNNLEQNSLEWLPLCPRQCYVQSAAEIRLHVFHHMGSCNTERGRESDVQVATLPQGSPNIVISRQESNPKPPWVLSSKQSNSCGKEIRERELVERRVCLYEFLITHFTAFQSYQLSVKKQLHLYSLPFLLY